MLSTTLKALPILLLAIVSSNAVADWVAVGSSKTDTLYVEPTTIRGTDDRARMWALNDYKVTQRLDNREPFKSEKAEYEYDCKQSQSRLLYFTSHTENMAGGEVADFNVAPGEWVPVSPKSEIEVLWKIACGKV
jgi:hypothetical protein